MSKIRGYDAEAKRKKIEEFEKELESPKSAAKARGSEDSEESSASKSRSFA